MTEPPVCVPTASGTMPAATAAAEPLDEPPGVCSTFAGLRVCDGARFASSVVTVLPSTIAPDAPQRGHACRVGVGTGGP